MEKVNDVLGRSEDAETVARFAAARATGPQGLVLNVDAAWGMGKTTFLRLLKERLGDDAVMVNAWESDFADDPLLPVLEAVTERLGKDGSPKLDKLRDTGQRIALSFMTGALRKGISLMTGGASDGLLDMGAAGAEAVMTREADTLLKRFEKQAETVRDFRRTLAEAVAERDTPLHILIDELDRCRPTYAIEMLERIKHLFGVSNVAFVIATDTEQLQHSIRAVYGEGFDAKAYLRRFFDRTYRFDEPDLRSYAKHLFEIAKFDTGRIAMPWGADPILFFGDFCQKTGLTLRDMDQCFAIIDTVVTLWDQKPKVNLGVLMPFVMLHQRNDIKAFEALARRSIDEVGSLRLPPIDISFGVVRTRDYETLKEFDFERLWWPFFKTLIKNLPDFRPLLGEGDLDPVQTEAAAVIQDNTLFDPNSDYRSRLCLLLRYPKLVRQAGRMKVLD